MKPLILLDVDGPLNPWAANPNRRPEGYQTFRMRPEGWKNLRQKPLRVWLNPDHKDKLLELPGDLVWATYWGAEANEWIAPALGLPDLERITWPDTGDRIGPSHRPGLHWKTVAILDFADERPFVWIDDEITDADRDYVSRHSKAPALLHHVSPRVGLTDQDFQTITTWLKENS